MTLRINPELVSCESNPKTQKLCWREATSAAIDLYQHNLSVSLTKVTISHEAINCSNPHWDDPDHRDFISSYCDDLIRCLVESANASIPKTGPPGRRVPGWNQYVRPYKDASLFWHRIWKECGSPATGVVSQIRRKARGEYHKAVRDANLLYLRKWLRPCAMIHHVIFVENAKRSVVWGNVRHRLSMAPPGHMT